MIMTNRNFLALPTVSWKEKNLEAKADRANRVSADGRIRDKRLKYLNRREERHQGGDGACSRTLEGRLHCLDYDKKFLLGAQWNLTFDGSCRFAASRHRRRRSAAEASTGALSTGSGRRVGNGKVRVFGQRHRQGGTPYSGDLRRRSEGAYADAVVQGKGLHAERGHEN